MWKNYIDIIKERDKDYSHQEYCIWFAGHFSYNIYSLSDFINLLEKENGDLLPISKNLTDFFYSLDIEALINLIYHINDISELDFIIMDNDNKTNLENLFSSITNTSYIFKLFSFDSEILLSEDKNHATLLFLFLFFIPQHKTSDSLYHYRKKIPLLCCNKITFNHFEMLLYLMKTYEEESFFQLCEVHNLNFILIEDFCQNSTDIYVVSNNEEWYNILPINKIKVLFNENCTLENYIQFSNNKIFRIVPTLMTFINYFQKELNFLKLKEKLAQKSQLNHKDKIIKL